MGIRSIFRAQQQVIAKEINTDFASGFEVPISGVSSSVLQTTRGRRWNFVRGIWGLSSGKISTTSSANYPIAVVDAFVPDVEISLTNVGQGAGAALWYTDEGNWWGIGTYQESEECNCTTSYYSCDCTPYTYGYNCTAYNTCTGYITLPDGYYTCVNQYRVNSTYVFNYCCSYGVINYNYVYGYTNTGCTNYCQGSNSSYVVDSVTCTPDFHLVCNQWTSGTYCANYATGYACSTCSVETCQTCYPAYIRLIQSIANSVSTLTSWAISAAARSLKVSTLNQQISVQPYSDMSLSQPIGQELEYDASLANETTRFGLMVSPSQYDEQMSVAQINIKRRK